MHQSCPTNSNELKLSFSGLSYITFEVGKVWGRRITFYLLSYKWPKNEAWPSEYEESSPPSLFSIIRTFLLSKKLLLWEYCHQSRSNPESWRFLSAFSILRNVLLCYLPKEHFDRINIMKIPPLAQRMVLWCNWCNGWRDQWCVLTCPHPGARSSFTASSCCPHRIEAVSPRS